MGSQWFSFGVALYALVLGVIVAVRAPRHPAHVSFAVGMMLLALECAAAALAWDAYSVRGDLEWMRLRMVVAALVAAPWVAFSRTYSRGDAAEVLRGRRRWVVVGAVLPAAFALVFHDALVRGPANPLAPGASPRLGWAGLAVHGLLLLASVAVLTHLERTFRGSVGVMRWRLKYMVLGVGALFGFRLYVTSQALLYQVPEEAIGRAGAAALLVGCILMTVALTRGSVFDVDVYPSHTLIYGSLTVLLAGTYLVIVGLLSHVVTLVGGVQSFPLKAFLVLVALAGLAVMLLSERIRQLIRRFVSRHLRRPVYDYRRVWSTFTAETTSLVDENAFCRTVASWVSGTFQALSASVWLVEESGDGLRLGASTVLADAAADQIDPPKEDLRRALETLEKSHEPVVLDVSRHPWAGVLVNLHPDVFRETGTRVCQPLIAGGKLLGLLILGDRVGYLPFTTEDFDLLWCVGDQVAASLLGLQLSARLVRAKEMEAFQTMSAFFVHDLKNTASTLSLTLQNLHRHFSDPAFRDDALRAVGKSVQHLNDLIARLSRLRQELRVQPVAGDMGAAVENALASAGLVTGVRMVKALEPIPPVLLDAEQFEKVVVNLLVNAREAVSVRGEGEITVAVSRNDGWGVLSVRDNGCGMSPEFVRKSLFRPFQTTKKNGLGIGMFHSKMIIEALRGRMEVDSVPGTGTTVRVLLPLADKV